MKAAEVAVMTKTLPAAVLRVPFGVMTVCFVRFCGGDMFLRVRDEEAVTIWGGAARLYLAT